MAVRLDMNSGDFAKNFRAFLDTKREAAADVEAAVRAIVADVAARGDDALKDYTREFDRFDLDRAGLRVTAREIAAAVTSMRAAPRSTRLNSPATRIEPITAARCRRTIASPMRSASSSARAGPRSRRSGFMCRAAPPPIRRRC